MSRRLTLRLFTKRHTGEHAAFVNWAARRVLPSSASSRLRVLGAQLAVGGAGVDEDGVDIEPVEVDAAPPHGVAAEGQFSAAHYFAELRVQGLRACGRRLLYAPVVTSTQELLTGPLLSELEDWSVAFVADEQSGGRGRGGNTWTSPRGCLMCSFQFSHSSGATLAMVQYVVALAIVRAVKSVAGAAAKVAIKWPNDIYACADPNASLSAAGQSEWRKLGGILCQSSFFQGRFIVTVGFGLNVSNTEPSICVQQLCGTGAASEATREVLLARIMNEMEPLLLDFSRVGFAGLKASYEANWMHTGQRVQLDGGKEQLVVVGLSDGGFLLARDEVSDRVHELHPDGNSFDWFKGLVKKKTQ